jgi:hypothetical protein
LFLGRYAVAITFGTPSHPQRQGQVERTVQSARQVFNRMSSTIATEWDNWLPAMLFVLRTRPSLPFDLSPFFVLYGRHPRLPDEWNCTLEESVLVPDMEEADDTENLIRTVADILVRHDLYLPQIRYRLDVKKDVMKKKYDMSTKDKIFKLGDKVLATNTRWNESSTELIPRWIGPYTVFQKYGNTYTLKDQELTLPRSYHANQLIIPISSSRYSLLSIQVIL